MDHEERQVRRILEAVKTSAGTRLLKKLLFIGDSLTEFFDWQGRFPVFEVTNLGIAGETVEGLLGRMGSICASTSDPDFVFLMTGINNIAMEEYDIADVYRAILNGLTSCFGNAKVVVQSILPVRLPWVEEGRISGINRSIEELVAQFGCNYLDLHRLFVSQDGQPVPGCLSDDGVHLSGRGYELWSGAVERFLGSAGRADAPDGLSAAGDN